MIGFCYKLPISVGFRPSGTWWLTSGPAQARAAQNDQRGPACERLGLKTVTEGFFVGRLPLQVQDDHLRPVPPRHGEPVSGCTRLEDLHSSALQCGFQYLPRLLGTIDDQDASFREQVR